MTPEFLFFMPHNPGDVVMSLHAAAQLRALIPDADIDFITGEECLDLLVENPMLRQTFALPRAPLLERWKSGDIDGAVKELSRWMDSLGKRRYHTAFNLFQGKFGGLLQGLLNADHKAGLEMKDGCRFEIGSRALEHLFAIPAQRGQNPFHAVDLHRLAVAESLGASLPAHSAPAVKIALPEDPAPFPKHSYFAFHPGAAFRGKRWPAERWVRLAELCLETGRNIVWTGSPEERELVLSIVEKIPDRYAAQQSNLAGTTTLRAAAAIYHGAERVVCGDTAAMHLAAAVNTPLIALFGPSNPVETGPYGIGHQVIHARLTTEADLRLEDDCPELAAIAADAVAQLLLRKTPSSLPSNSLWRTDWDSRLGLQILRDAGGEIHPFQRNAETWLSVLQKRNPSDATLPETPLFQALTRAQTTPDAETLSRLEQEESHWAESTRDNFIWEAYRIALNGLPVLPLPRYLKLRQQRLRQAYGEAKTLSVVSRLPKS